MFKSKLNLKYIFSGAFWLGSANVFLGLSSLFVIFVLANTLTQESFGFYNFFLALLPLIGLFLLPGMNAGLVVSVSKGYEKTYDYLIKQRLKLSLFTTIGFLAVATYFYAIESPYWLILVIAAFIFPFHETFNFQIPFLNGKENFKGMFWFHVGSKLIIWMPVALISFLTKSVFAVLLTFLLLGTLYHVGSYLFVRRQIENDHIDDRSLKYGFKLTLVDLLPKLAEYLDKIIVTFFLGLIELASYALTIMWGTQIKKYIGMETELLLPEIRKYKEERMYFAIREKLVLIFAFNVVIVGSAIVAVYYLIPLLFPVYEDIVLYVQLLFASQIFLFVGNTVQTFLVGEEQIMFLGWLKTGTSILKLLLFFILIFIFGIWGAIFTLVVTELLEDFLLLGYFINYQKHYS